jgi:hypothetical protein
MPEGPAPTWTTPESIRARVQRDWERGKWLAAIATETPLFPLRLALKGPDSRELSERFDAVRAWIERLQGAERTGARAGYRLVLREVKHRVIGSNVIPSEVWIDSLDDALALIGKRREAERFRSLHEQTRQRFPALLPWLARRPLRALELAEDWGRLLDIVTWLQAHPRPGIYLRQVDLPGIHSKFIERHKGVLAELFDLALPREAIDTASAGHAGFARRYGFRDKPGLIRFRILDERKALLATGTDNDLSVTTETFARLDPDITRVFITENEINFLAFPRVADGLVIFGAGYGFEMLDAARWLQERTLHYWGDIDTHGFAILDQLRARFAHVRSLLMDRETLLAHHAHWIEEPQPTRRDLPRLSPVEAALYDELRHDTLGRAVRLEQEKIGFDWIEAALEKLPPLHGTA